MSGLHRIVFDTSTLVSSDADLLVLNPWQGIPILTPGAFLRPAPSLRA